MRIKKYILILMSFLILLFSIAINSYAAPKISGNLLDIDHAAGVYGVIEPYFTVRIPKIFLLKSIDINTYDLAAKGDVAGVDVLNISIEEPFIVCKVSIDSKNCLQYSKMRKESEASAAIRNKEWISVRDFNGKPTDSYIKHDVLIVVSDNKDTLWYGTSNFNINFHI